MKNEKGSNELIQMFNQLPSSYSKNEKNDDSDNEDNQQNQKKGKDNFKIPQYAKKEEKNIENEDDYNSDEEDDEEYDYDESNAHETHKKVKNVGDSVTDWIARASKCNFQFLKQYFNVTEKIVMKRGSYSLIPFNPYFHNISKEKPDLYGPIWIFNTLIFIIAASGELTSYFHGDKNKSYFEMFVPYSALLVSFINYKRYMESVLDYHFYCL